MNQMSASTTSPAVMLDLLKEERERRNAAASLYEFVRQSWHVVEPGVPFIGGWHIEQICEHLEACSGGSEEAANQHTTTPFQIYDRFRHVAYVGMANRSSSKVFVRQLLWQPKHP